MLDVSWCEATPGNFHHDWTPALWTLAGPMGIYWVYIYIYTHNSYRGKKFGLVTGLLYGIPSIIYPLVVKYGVTPWWPSRQWGKYIYCFVYSTSGPLFGYWFVDTENSTSRNVFGYWYVLTSRNSTGMYCSIFSPHSLTSSRNRTDEVVEFCTGNALTPPRQKAMEPR